jgi:DNA-binding GntR family transcriptional regulator
MSVDPIASEDPLATVGPRESLRDVSAQRLQAAIMTGYLRPGIVYSARALSAQLGISATPVREAMLDLVKEGLVEAIPNKGFRVVQLTGTELDELTQLRELIEVPTVRRIAERGIDDQAGLGELAALASELERTAHDKDGWGHLTADLKFHLKLLSYANNQSLVDIVHRLRIRSRLFGIPELADRGELADTAREHAQLLELVRSRDAAAAEELMRRHIGHVRGVWATGDGADY